MKLCIDCQHYIKAKSGPTYDKCTRIEKHETDYVHGGTIVAYEYATIERESKGRDRCGPDARFFVARAAEQAA